MPAMVNKVADFLKPLIAGFAFDQGLSVEEVITDGGGAHGLLEEPFPGCVFKEE